MSEKLKPCPFCGGKAEVAHSWADPRYCTVSCLTENCMGKNWEQDEQGGFASEHRGAQAAIAAWNRRAEVTP